MKNCKILFTELFSNKNVKDSIQIGETVFFLFEGKLSSQKHFFKGVVKKTIDIGVIVDVVNENNKVVKDKHFVDVNLLYIEKEVII